MSGSRDASSLTRAERIHRTRARSWVLQILYRWEIEEARRPLDEVAAEVFRTRRVAPEREPLVRRRLETVARRLPELDRALQKAMENWRLDRLSRVDRSILRLGAAEILFVDEVPPKVAIQEAIRLAGQYGGEESPRFVNGVLDAVFRAAPGPRS